MEDILAEVRRLYSGLEEDLKELYPNGLGGRQSKYDGALLQILLRADWERTRDYLTKARIDAWTNLVKSKLEETEGALVPEHAFEDTTHSEIAQVHERFRVIQERDDHNDLSIIEDLRKIRSQLESMHKLINRKRERNARKNALESLKIGIPSLAIVTTLILALHPELYMLIVWPIILVASVTLLSYLGSKYAPRISRATSRAARFLEAIMVVVVVLIELVVQGVIPIPYPGQFALYLIVGGLVAVVVFALICLRRSHW